MKVYNKICTYKNKSTTTIKKNILSCKAQFFPPEFNIGLFSFSSAKIRIFFSATSGMGIFF
jgi:hypothetical protein